MVKVRKGIGITLKMITRIKGQKQEWIRNKKKCMVRIRIWTGSLYSRIKGRKGQRTKGPKDVRDKRNNKTVMVRMNSFQILF